MQIFHPNIILILRRFLSSSWDLGFHSAVAIAILGIYCLWVQTATDYVRFCSHTKNFCYSFFFVITFIFLGKPRANQ